MATSKVLLAATLLALLKPGVPSSAKALKLATPEQLGIAPVRGHGVGYDCGHHLTFGVAHSA